MRNGTRGCANSPSSWHPAVLPTPLGSAAAILLWERRWHPPITCGALLKALAAYRWSLEQLEDAILKQNWSQLEQELQTTQALRPSSSTVRRPPLALQAEFPSARGHHLPAGHQCRQAHSRCALARMDRISAQPKIGTGVRPARPKGPNRSGFVRAHPTIPLGRPVQPAKPRGVASSACSQASIFEREPHSPHPNGGQQLSVLRCWYSGSSMVCHPSGEVNTLAITVARPSGARPSPSWLTERNREPGDA